MGSILFLGRRAPQVVLASCLVAGFGIAAAAAQVEPVRSRIAVIVDTSTAMRQTPEFLTFTETCTAPFNPCTFTGNPSAAQESCNACVRDTIALDASCGGTGLWDASCRAAYVACVAALTGQACTATLISTASVTTRGDGSAEQPGCDLDGNSLADDNRFFVAKESLREVLFHYDEVEYELWRFRQVVGGQVCDSSPSCPDTPGGLSILECEDVDSSAGTPSRCALDADRLDGPTTAGFEGQCSVVSYTGSPAGFACTACNFTSTYDRATCELFDLDRVRTGASSLFGGATVTCYPQVDPAHRFQLEHGAVDNAGVCDPSGSEPVVLFPLHGFADNRATLASWIDHETQISEELHPDGLRPIAASLRDLRTALLEDFAEDDAFGCRPYAAIVIAGGTESCETAGDGVTAAAALLDVGVPVHVFGIGLCPSTSPNCQAQQDLDDVAEAGGTNAAVVVANQAELTTALDQVVAATVVHEICGDGIDDDCDGVPDNGCPLFTDGFESGDTSAWSEDAPP